MTGHIEWDLPLDSSVDNFTITISSLDDSIDLMTTVVSSPLSNVTLNYNTNYTISIRGRNCAGRSTPAVLLYMECEWKKEAREFFDTGLAQECYALWDEATNAWDW